MKYASQKVALVYFAGAMALFVVQLLFGLLAAAVYAMPNFLAEATIGSAAAWNPSSKAPEPVVASTVPLTIPAAMATGDAATPRAPAQNPLVCSMSSSSRMGRRGQPCPARKYKTAGILILPAATGHRAA